MPAYLLRSAGSKRFIGLYAADNEGALWLLIHEETDPRRPSGATSPAKPPLPRAPVSDEGDTGRRSRRVNDAWLPPGPE
jgi:hypothetical protein